MPMQQTLDTAPERVEGRTLNEALRNVRRLHGENARIVESRHVYRRGASGLGRDRMVEVLVAVDGAETSDTPSTASVAGPRTAAGLTAAIGEEVARIEAMVQSVARRELQEGPGEAAVIRYPLGEALLKAGASYETVAALARRHEAESVEGGPGAVEHLKSHLNCSDGKWEDFAGCHLMLGAPGAGKTELVLGIAARLVAEGKRTLVLSVAPRHEGEVRRLQQEASTHGYDAAVLREAAQLERSLPYFEKYDVVLIDTPALGSRQMDQAGLREFIGLQQSIHRHLVVPVDGDPAELDALLDASRDWNCDWAALSRLDLCSRPGKLLDLGFRLPVPFSLVAGGTTHGAEAGIADRSALLRSILGEALPAETVAAVAESC